MFWLWGERFLMVSSWLSDTPQNENLTSIMLVQSLNIQVCFSFRRPVAVKKTIEMNTK